MPGMPARQRGPCRGCHARKATGAMPVVPCPQGNGGHAGGALKAPENALKAPGPYRG